MIIVDVFAALAIVGSFVGGIAQGAIKSIFSLISLLIALPVTGLLYPRLVGLLGFVHSTNWENFLGYFITLGVLTAILHLIFWMPRKVLEKFMGKGLLGRILGGTVSVISSAIGLAVFAFVLAAFPIWGWLAEATASSEWFIWIVKYLAVVQNLLPELMRH